jgi:hypothetical protein
VSTARYYVMILLLILISVSVTDTHPEVASTTALKSLQQLRTLGDNTSCTQSCPICIKPTHPSDIQRKFFFLHIPKTGGLSIEMDIRKVVCGGTYLTKNKCFCGRNHRQFAALKNNSFRYKSSPITYGWKNFSVFSGHEYWGMLPKFIEEAKPVLATVLREPLARAVSHWNMVAGRSLGFDNRNNLTFSEAIRYSIRVHGTQQTLAHRYGSAIRNEQIRYLCGVDCPDTMPLRTALSISKANLARTAIVGIFEDFDGILDQFRAVLPWWPSKAKFGTFSTANSANETRNMLKRRYHKKSRLKELDGDVLRMLQDFLAPEREIYEFGQQLAAAKTEWVRTCSSLAQAHNCAGFTSDCF